MLTRAWSRLWDSAGGVVGETNNRNGRQRYGSPNSDVLYSQVPTRGSNICQFVMYNCKYINLFMYGT